MRKLRVSEVVYERKYVFTGDSTHQSWIRINESKSTYIATLSPEILVAWILLLKVLDNFDLI
ncbi:hypothetical protein Smp_000540 [Schistosoma mansoni]|uniref:hypothetical protein n=1 Tax=Schistosoma mansoni TaxID=6183 RepID=UPI0001A61ACB|nr:hypothetical protein Smp_000540 [Schistosoma mansoni]|eukprot:XP_018646313.1 hypothetical protein Smp_000540 [Schistosoma mansoni]